MSARDDQAVIMENSAGTIDRSIDWLFFYFDTFLIVNPILPDAQPQAAF